ncbi:MAG: VWA domain-containing protein [Ichthyobacteriaceae bacterium]|nr:VWA domain-containing protein [Ichthyobacteriaceae bacterium]
MYELEEKSYFNYLIIIAVLVAIFLFNRFWKAKKQKEFASAEMLNVLAPNRSIFKQYLKMAMLMLVFLMMIIALVNPKVGSKLKTVKRAGVDIVFALDVSKSMLAEDVAPNRLMKSKQIISKVIDELGGDRIGIIAYAGKSYPLLPITTDYAAAKMMLKNADTDMIPSQGTAIASAIEMTNQYFDDEDQQNRILVIISDGEDHEAEALSSAEMAKSKGIKIYSIGVGTTSGGPIPIKQNGNVVGYKKDKNGDVVVTQLDKTVLMEVAQLTEGKYIDSKDTRHLVSELTDVLKGMDKKEFETQVFADYEDQFQWFVGLAVLFLILDVFFLERKTKWVEKLGLFEDKIVK